MNDLACLGEHVGHRRLRPPVDLQVRQALPDGAGNGQVPLDMAEADRGGDPQRPAAAAVGGLPGGLLPPPGHQPVGKVADRVVHRDRIPDVRRVPAAPYHEEFGVRKLGDPPGPFGRDDLVLVAADHQDRARQGAAELGRLGLIRDLLRGIRIAQHGVGVGLHAPLHEIVVGLGGVRLGGDLRHEELDVSPPVPPPVVPVLLRPSLGGVEDVVEGALVPFPGVHWRDRQGRRDRDDAGHPLRLGRCEQQGPDEACAEPGQHRALRARRIKDRPDVAGEGGIGIGRRIPGPVGPAVPARVERDHPVVSGQERHLHLPVPGVHDRPCGQQQEGRLTGAVHLVVNPHA